MKLFMQEFGIALLVMAALGIIALAALFIAEKYGLAEKLSNMFNDPAERD